jgi:hypothetical protein
LVRVGSSAVAVTAGMGVTVWATGLAVAGAMVEVGCEGCRLQLEITRIRASSQAYAVALTRLVAITRYYSSIFLKI